MSVERSHWTSYGMAGGPSGEWVRYSDHERELAEVREMNARLNSHLEELRLVHCQERDRAESAEAAAEGLREAGAGVIEALGFGTDKLRLSYEGPADAVEEFEEALHALRAALSTTDGGET